MRTLYVTERSLYLIRSFILSQCLYVTYITVVSGRWYCMITGKDQNGHRRGDMLYWCHQRYASCVTNSDASLCCRPM